MKVATLNAFDLDGGAARAAFRIHKAVSQIGVDSTMMVDVSRSGDASVIGPIDLYGKVRQALRSRIGKLPTRLLQTDNRILHSPSILPSGRAKGLNASDADLIHLHWVNNEMLSIKDIGSMTKPVLWTLHDMWAFSGAEHYASDCRWKEGYNRKNRPPTESGFDLNRWTAHRKLKHWRKPIQIVAPSNWLAQCVQESRLMTDWPVKVIPNAINTEAWRPIEKEVARNILDLPQDRKLILFGALGGEADPRKGADLLYKALSHLNSQSRTIEIVVFGQREPSVRGKLDLPVRYMGELYDDISLQLLYSAVDVMVIPSRQDNLPNTGVEAISCGTPVVAFNVGGIPDIVLHERTGYLATAFDTLDLANGISWAISTQQVNLDLRKNCRAYAVEKFSFETVGRQYRAIYQELLEA